MIDDSLASLYSAAFDGMSTTGPHKLLLRVQNEAALRDAPHLATQAALLEALAAPNGASQLAARIRFELARWDAGIGQGWTASTPPKTTDRRQAIYLRLELPAPIQERFDVLFPVATEGGGVIITADFEDWYGSSLRDRPPFYWKHYETYLATKKWHTDAIANLGLNTTRVVERLADPFRGEAYQAKGLVVGYVQSGKTANFTGVIAKAIDAGYRLIIVLTGQTDLLRTQTQRRLDKELVGKENLLRGIDHADADSLVSVDYWGDGDWHQFVGHDDLPSNLGRPDIIRLTTKNGDYKALRQGIEALDFVKVDPRKPLNAPDNLRQLPARLAVVKKNSKVLGDFVKDLKKITAKLGDIPALIIDDESDQASVNTLNPKKVKDGERTAINGHIAALLRLLPRGQYVGYTATPFANVFVDPSDAEDIFPSTFLLSLDPPPDYMGAQDFHDLEFSSDPPTYANSNEMAYVRSIRDTGEDDPEDLRKALDAFVLSGSIKLWRSQAGSMGSFRHHTMLVHESVRQAEHKVLARRILDLWNASAWFSPASTKRLRRLFDDDFLPVMHARGSGEPSPTSFDDVKQFVGEVANRVAGTDNKPVWIVNGDKEVAELDLDFDARPVWKVLVGGAKLSRGFTVEGLTVSYYRRSTRQADTLMQMGRWFGFRPGYRDLVRLYIGRTTSSRANTYDIYKAFEAACRSEELFREEIKKYGHIVDGQPQLTPAEVPPLVAQYVPWLKPAATNKMYNARLVERRSPGTPLEPTGYSSEDADRAANAATVRPLVAVAITTTHFQQSARKTFAAFVGVVSHADLLAALKALVWSPADHFEADLAWLANLKSSQIEDWVVLLPQLVGSGSTRTLFGRELDVHARARRKGRSLFGGISDPKHRRAAATIAGLPQAFEDAEAEALTQPRRGSILLYPVFEIVEGGDEAVPADIQAEDLIMALTIHAPMSTGSPDKLLVRFQARDPRTNAVVIDVPPTAP